MPKKGVRTTFVIICRLNPRPPPPLSRKEATVSESTRCGRTQPSEDRRPWLSPVLPSTQERVFNRCRPGTSTPSLSTHLALRAPSRPLKTTTHWCSLLTEELTNQWSRKLAKNSTASRSQELTLSLDPMVSRRPTSSSHLSRMPLILPTRSALCEINITRSLTSTSFTDILVLF